MRQFVRKTHLKNIMIMTLGVLLVATSGMSVVHAQRNDKKDAVNSHNHHTAPVWQEVDRTIQLNPDNPAPPEIVSQLVSLDVAYRDFDGRQRQGIIEVNRGLKDEVLQFFRYAFYLNFPLHEVAPASDPRFKWDDKKLMAADITSGFNYREIAGTGRPSTHSTGESFDVNPRENPYITLDDDGNPFVQPKGASWNLGAPGTLHRDHALIQLMKSHGWIWGGDWTLQDDDGAVIDYQHLQRRLPTES